MEDSHTEIAIRIICGARGGRCGRQLGVARINSLIEPATPVMILSNEGWALSAGYPLLEDSVPPDFSGSTGILGCPDHGFLITERSGDPPIAPGFPRGKWAKGMSVPLYFSLLRGPYAEHLRTSQTTTIKWVPAANPTISDRGDGVLGKPVRWCQLKTAPVTKVAEPRPWQVGPQGGPFMLRSFDFSALAGYWSVGLSVVLATLHLVRMCSRRSFLRIPLARPLWWLAARFLALPDASARYARFRDRAIAKWEALLLGERPDQS